MEGDCRQENRVPKETNDDDIYKLQTDQQCVCNQTKLKCLERLMDDDNNTNDYEQFKSTLCTYTTEQRQQVHAHMCVMFKKSSRTYQMVVKYQCRTCGLYSCVLPNAYIAGMQDKSSDEIHKENERAKVRDPIVLNAKALCIQAFQLACQKQVFPLVRWFVETFYDKSIEKEHSNFSRILPWDGEVLFIALGWKQFKQENKKNTIIRIPTFMKQKKDKIPPPLPLPCMCSVLEQEQEKHREKGNRIFMYLFEQTQIQCRRVCGHVEKMIKVFLYAALQQNLVVLDFMLVFFKTHEDGFSETTIKNMLFNAFLWCAAHKHTHLKVLQYLHEQGASGMGTPIAWYITPPWMMRRSQLRTKQRFLLYDFQFVSDDSRYCAECTGLTCTDTLLFLMEHASLHDESFYETMLSAVVVGNLEIIECLLKHQHAFEEHRLAEQDVENTSAASAESPWTLEEQDKIVMFSFDLKRFDVFVLLLQYKVAYRHPNNTSFAFRKWLMEYEMYSVQLVTDCLLHMCLLQKQNDIDDHVCKQCGRHKQHEHLIPDRMGASQVCDTEDMIPNRMGVLYTCNTEYLASARIQLDAEDESCSSTASASSKTKLLENSVSMLEHVSSYIVLKCIVARQLHVDTIQIQYEKHTSLC